MVHSTMQSFHACATLIYQRLDRLEVLKPLNKYTRDTYGRAKEKDLGASFLRIDDMRCMVLDALKKDVDEKTIKGTLPL